MALAGTEVLELAGPVFLLPTMNAEFLSFVRNQEECRKRWHAAELAVLSLQTENSILKTENKKLNEKLVHTK